MEASLDIPSYSAELEVAILDIQTGPDYSRLHHRISEASSVVEHQSTRSPGYEEIQGKIALLS